MCDVNNYYDLQVLITNNISIPHLRVFNCKFNIFITNSNLFKQIKKHKTFTILYSIN